MAHRALHPPPMRTIPTLNGHSACTTMRRHIVGLTWANNLWDLQANALPTWRLTLHRRVGKAEVDIWLDRWSPLAGQQPPPVSANSFRADGWISTPNVNPRLLGKGVRIFVPAGALAETLLRMRTNAELARKAWQGSRREISWWTAAPRRILGVL